ncbi:hypothetical protein BDW67DRAFT_158241 [Aspergillus spinulosporus]
MQQFNSFFKSKSSTSTNASTNANTEASPALASDSETQPPQRRESQDPVLTPEDEAFLQTLTAESTPAGQDAVPAPVGDGDRDEETALSAGVQTQSQDQTPKSPIEEFGKEMGEQERRKSAAGLEPSLSGDNNAEKVMTRAGESSRDNEKGKESANLERSKSPEKKRRPWSMIWKRSEKKASQPQIPETALSTSNDSSETEQQRENADMTAILDKLNLAADNNRVFSISDETQDLLRKFKLIFKDLINGVPTAYHDLEMLLTNGNKQLQDTYSNLPSFLQKLIEKLPEKWTESIAPEMIAVAAERASRSGVNVDNIGKAAAAANKLGISVPSLKELVGKPAAIVGMLRSIMAFLRARFPAVLGMNVLWSLALFILLFVLWYCHKRGREVRLENERLVTEGEIEKMNQESTEGTAAQTAPPIRSTETLTTTAAHGASASEVRQGIKEAQEAREKKTKAKALAAREQFRKGDKPGGIENEPIKPTRSKSILSIFGRSGSQNSALSERKIEPYPGT